MNYLETIEYIHKTPKFSRVLGNDMLRRLLGFLGDPHKRLNFIHIAGTNGKGSVSAMTAEILKRAGFKTGLFTSPYIERFNERIRINGEPIPDERLASAATEVRSVMEKTGAFVSEFALDLAIALKYFAEEGCDPVILETGMGGRLDATNVIEKSLVSAIVSISLDHTQYLGGTVEEIAAEKCGIIKNNGKLVSYPGKDPAAEAVIEKTCRERGAEYILCGLPVQTEAGFIYKNREYPLSLKGTFQPYNGAVAAEIISALIKQGYEIPVSAVVSGFENTQWPARFEFIGDNLIIDGGHNPEGAEALCASLKKLNRPVHIVAAMMEDKAVEACVRIFSTAALRATAAQLDMPRCCKSEILAALFEKYGVSCDINPDPAEAVRAAVEKSKADNALVCVCGSLYLAGAVRSSLRLSK